MADLKANRIMIPMLNYFDMVQDARVIIEAATFFGLTLQQRNEWLDAYLKANMKWGKPYAVRC